MRVLRYVHARPEAARARLADWQAKFGAGLGLRVVGLTGESASDVKLLDAGQIVVATAEQWDMVRQCSRAPWHGTSTRQGVAIKYRQRCSVLDDLPATANTPRKQQHVPTFFVPTNAPRPNLTPRQPP